MFLSHSTARVYAILSVQLLVTAGSCIIFGLNPGIARSLVVPGSRGALVPSISLLLSTIAWFMMCVHPDNRRKAPMKWNLLALFTIGEAISVGFVSSFYNFASVVQAMVTTGIATFAVSAYTMLQNNPDRDLSQMGASLST
jgi:FtsH-binding integral membrane protein